jgi:hypothetical protein
VIVNSKTEEWRDIPGYEGAYQASSLGRVRSLDRFIAPGRGVTRRFARGRVLRSSGVKYLQLCLYDNGHRVRSEYVHSLVARSFLGPCPDGMEVAHNDGDRLNNRVSNLRYATRKDNHADKRLHGTQPSGERHPKCRLTDDDIAEIRVSRRSGKSVRDIADEFDISDRYVRRIVALQVRSMDGGGLA